jgi:GTP-binding protein EngB required for normal cell division
MDISGYIASIDNWYRAQAGPLLRELDAAASEGFERDLVRLRERSTTLHEPATICVVGKSGIGKSTLINALVGESVSVVPAGGVGPLTAHALRIRSGSKRRLTVSYHGANQLWRLIFSLKQMFPDAGIQLSDVDRTAAEGQGVVEDSGGEAPPDLIADAPGNDSAGERRSAEAQDARLERARSFRKMAQLIVGGDQNVELPIAYLAQALRSVMPRAKQDGFTVRPEHAENLSEVRQALAMQGQSRVFDDGNETEFRRILRRHAAGNLSPLISEFLLEYPSDLLDSGLQFVDLPGTGIASDTFRERAREWMTEHARAVLVVVDHRGVDESVAQILHESNFLNSLLYYSDDMPQERPILMAAITKLDDIARSEYSNADREQRMPMVEYFKQAGEKARQVVRNGIQEQLEKASLGGAQRGDEGVGISPAKSEAMAGLIARMEIFPVAATDYRDLSMRDEEVSTTLKRLEDTNIPQLKQYLKNFSGQLRRDREQQLLSAAVGLHDRVTLALKVQQESWAGRAMERGVEQRLGEKLRVFLEPLRADFHRRQGQMR